MQYVSIQDDNIFLKFSNSWSVPEAYQVSNIKMTEFFAKVVTVDITCHVKGIKQSMIALFPRRHKT